MDFYNEESCKEEMFSYHFAQDCISHSLSKILSSLALTISLCILARIPSRRTSLPVAFCIFSPRTCHQPIPTAISTDRLAPGSIKSLEIAIIHEFTTVPPVVLKRVHPLNLTSWISMILFRTKRSFYPLTVIQRLFRVSLLLQLWPWIRHLLKLQGSNSLLACSSQSRFTASFSTSYSFCKCEFPTQFFNDFCFMAPYALLLWHNWSQGHHVSTMWPSGVTIYTKGLDTVGTVFIVISKYTKTDCCHL